MDFRTNNRRIHQSGASSNLTVNKVIDERTAEDAWFGTRLILGYLG